MWREVVPGFPWLAGLVKRAGFWLSEDLSGGSKVDNNRRQVATSALHWQACMRVRVRTHTCTYTRRERERDKGM